VGLESSPTKISDLNSAWPLSTDDPKYGDDHLRNIKAVLAALDTATAELRGRLVSVQKFTADGTWTRPTGVRYVLVKSKGGGGGGAGTGASQTYSGGGGGEGGYCEEFIDVTATATAAVTVGDGGAGGVGENNGSDGEDTTFSAFHTAGGGKGGKCASATATKNYYRGGVGGTAVGGDINLPGACGQCELVAGAPQVSGTGGGQGGGRGRSSSEDSAGNGFAGTANSGGGGSAAFAGGSAYNGGAGGSGFCTVYEYT